MIPVTTLRDKKVALFGLGAAEDAEDDRPDEQHDSDDREPEQALERESHDRQHNPCHEQDDQNCPHVAHATRAGASIAGGRAASPDAVGPVGDLAGQRLHRRRVTQ